MPRVGVRVWAALLAVVFVVFLVAAFGAQRALGAGTVLEAVDGDVVVSRAGTPEAALVGKSIRPGDEITTGPDGRAVLVFFDGSTVTLDPSTAIRVEEASAPGGSLFIAVLQTAGATWHSVQRLTDANARYEVRTPIMVAAVRGTAFSVIVGEEDSRVVTEEGKVAVEAQGTTVLVQEQQRTIVPTGQAPRPPEAAPKPRRVLEVTLDGAGTLVDSSGRRVGVLPNGAVRNTIPGARVEKAADGTVRLVIRDASPDLRLVSTGAARAKYEVRDGAGNTLATGTAPAKEKQNENVKHAVPEVGDQLEASPTPRTRSTSSPRVPIGVSPRPTPSEDEQNQTRSPGSRTRAPESPASTLRGIPARTPQPTSSPDEDEQGQGPTSTPQRGRESPRLLPLPIVTTPPPKTTEAPPPPARTPRPTAEATTEPTIAPTASPAPIATTVPIATSLPIGTPAATPSPTAAPTPVLLPALTPLPSVTLAPFP